MTKKLIHEQFFKDPASISPKREIQKRPGLDNQTFLNHSSMAEENADSNHEKNIDSGRTQIKNDYVPASDVSMDRLMAVSAEDHGSQDTFVEGAETSPALISDQSLDFVDAYISAPESHVPNPVPIVPLNQNILFDLASGDLLEQTLSALKLSEAPESKSKPIVPLQLLNLPEEGFGVDFGYNEVKESVPDPNPESLDLPEEEGEPLVIVAPKVLELSRTSSGASLSQIIRGWEATYEKSQTMDFDDQSNGYFRKQKLQPLDDLPKLSLAPLELSPLSADSGLDIDFESVARFPTEKEEIKKAEPIRWIKVQSVAEMPVAASLYIPPGQTGGFDIKPVPTDFTYSTIKQDSTPTVILPPLPPRPTVVVSKEVEVAEPRMDPYRRSGTSSPSKKVSFGVRY